MYPVYSSKKSRMADFQYLVIPKCHNALASSDKTSSKNDAKLIIFGRVLLILWSFLGIQSFSLICFVTYMNRWPTMRFPKTMYGPLQGVNFLTL